MRKQWRIKEVAALLLTSRLSGEEECVVSGLQADSREVQQGDLFVCITGNAYDGSSYAAEAVSKGAAAVVAEHYLSELSSDIPQLIVKDARGALALLAAHFYDFPSSKLRLVGVTGTNGKTTTVHLLSCIMQYAQKKCLTLGTLGAKLGSELISEGERTTPGALELQRTLAFAGEQGAEYGIMEVSSHALVQSRVKHCRFRTAIFTNLTQDHLDYHESMGEYLAAKELLFSRLGNGRAALEESETFAIINGDDPASIQLARATASEVIRYGLGEECDVKGSALASYSGGIRFTCSTFAGEAEIHLPLAGHYNVYNALGAIAAALVEGISLEQIKEALEAAPGVPGRVEAIDEGQSFQVIVDYAHTPDGLRNVLQAVRQHAEGKLICVFGCGGDRDRAKRSQMGKVAAELADYIIVTSDNPRTEEPIQIMHEVELGITESHYAQSCYTLCIDRRKAIQLSVEMAGPGDVVLIAGKGHEAYQLIGEAVLPFDDRREAAEAIRGIMS